MRPTATNSYCFKKSPLGYGCKTVKKNDCVFGGKATVVRVCRILIQNKLYTKLLKTGTIIVSISCRLLHLPSYLTFLWLVLMNLLLQSNSPDVLLAESNWTLNAFDIEACPPINVRVSLNFPNQIFKSVNNLNQLIFFYQAYTHYYALVENLK